MMSTTMVAVLVSACFMQEVSGAFLSRADPKDDASCAQCLPAANKFLGSDCKELRCLVQKAAAAATKLSSADDRKKASKAYGVFRGCAKENKCNLDIAIAAAEEFHINFEDIASLFQVDDESTEDDDESSEDEEADAPEDELELDEDAPEPTAENREFWEKEAAMQLAEKAEKDGFLQVVDDDESGQDCEKCLAPANKLLGADCKDPVCVVKEFYARKTEIVASKEIRKEVLAVQEGISRCAKENKCDLQPALTAASELGIDDFSSFLQVDDESTQDEDADEDADAASEQESELKEAERQLSEDSEDREEESAHEGSEQEEAEDHDDSLVVSKSESQGEAMREAAEESAYTASTEVEDDASCAKCLAPANKLVGADCKNFVCVVKAFYAKKKLIRATEDGRKQQAAVEESVSRCVKENKCEVQPAITAAYELGMDWSDLAVEDSSLNSPKA